MLKTRILTALVLLGLFLPALFYLPMIAWAGLMMALTLLCLREWAGFLMWSPQATRIYLAVSALLGLSLLGLLASRGFHWFFYQSMQWFSLATVFWLLVVPVAIYRNQFSRSPWLNALLGWGLLLALWMALVVTQEINPKFLLVIISTIWLADSAAYFAGKHFGRHKLAPLVSPGKTWEGVAGALLAVAGYAALLRLSGAVTTWWVLPCLWVVTIAGVYGDLFESHFKRRANLKDSGNILPGHGGLLDRVDGVIPALPIGLCMVYWFHYFQQTYSF